MPHDTAANAAHDSLVLIGLQALAAVTVATPALLVVGACAAWVPLLGTTAAAFVWMRRRGVRSPQWLSRARVRRLAVHSGFVHGLLATVAYVVAYAALPSQFDVPATAVLLLAPTLGIGVGLVALAVTLCGGDGAAASLGAWSTPGQAGDLSHEPR